jgi:hypothetical protein
MADVGFQSRGDYQSPHGFGYLRVVKARKIIARHCEVGDIIAIERSNGQIAPMTDGVVETYAEYLIKCGIAVRHQLKAGDKPMSCKIAAPSKLESPEEERIRLESAMLKPQIKAEQAVTGRQKASF